MIKEYIKRLKDAGFRFTKLRINYDLQSLQEIKHSTLRKQFFNLEYSDEDDVAFVVDNYGYITSIMEN